jgi:hypothetical protein
MRSHAVAISGIVKSYNRLPAPEILARGNCLLVCGRETITFLFSEIFVFGNFYRRLSAARPETRFSERNAYLNVRIPPGKQNALEEAPEADSIPSGEARQRSKPRQRIPRPKGRAADSAMLERHAPRFAEAHDIPADTFRLAPSGGKKPWEVISRGEDNDRDRMRRQGLEDIKARCRSSAHRLAAN